MWYHICCHHTDSAFNDTMRMSEESRDNTLGDNYAVKIHSVQWCERMVLSYIFMNMTVHIISQSRQGYECVCLWFHELREAEWCIYVSGTKVIIGVYMAWCLFGAKQLSKSMLEFCQLYPWKKTSVKLYRYLYLFIKDNAFENVVCQMVPILSRPRCVNLS